MSKVIAILGLAVVLAMGSAPARCETFQFDFDPFTEGIQNTVTVSVGETFEAHIVVTGALNLLGVSTDVQFPTTNLSLTDILENPADLDFNSTVSGPELNDVINFFIVNVRDNEPDWPLTAEDPESQEQFVDSQGRRSGVLVDLDGDNFLSGPELNRVIFAFIQDVRDPAGVSERVLYWTDKIASRAGFEANESVEIFDPPALSNGDGAHPGEILDITAVLLARPADAEGGRVDFGYDSETYGDAVIATLKFQAAEAGTATLSFREPVFIRESFENIDTDILDADGVDAVVTIQ